MATSWLHKAAMIASVLAPLALAGCMGGADEGTVIARTADGSEHRFAVQIADTQDSRRQGLMFVTELGANEGMLFDFKEERQVAFWMQNTLIPLDMIFARSDGTIANVHANARPRDTTSIPSDGAVQFVLEIPGGRSAEIGLKAGDTLVHPRMNAGE
ncbi:DUF192 domain-containing protein [Cucumibacter marinus]|uniref:DUF192 domain-containing protein n=1 Tax=Cucumibacter marinus TaxID=1121252 RepID=UPI0004102C8F|nr:DUF192 domain-containing protein [Cucumibacter marinus]